MKDSSKETKVYDTMEEGEACWNEIDYRFEHLMFQLDTVLAKSEIAIEGNKALFVFSAREFGKVDDGIRNMGYTVDHVELTKCVEPFQFAMTVTIPEEEVKLFKDAVSEIIREHKELERERMNNPERPF